jgi:CHAT domain-containing protein
VTRDAEVVYVDLGDSAPIEAAAATFAAGCRSRDATRDAGVWLAAGKTLRERVLAPLESHLPQGLRTLYLSPDAALSAVPFSALPGKSPGTCLVDEVRISLVTMAQDLLPSMARAAAGEGALLVGGVDFDRADGTAMQATPSKARPETSVEVASLDRAPSGTTFGPLPATSQEVETLRQRLGGSTRVLQGAKATEANLRDAAAGRRLVHLATHGFVREDLLAGLRLRDDEHDWERGGTSRFLAAGHDPMVLCGLALAGANPRDGGGGDDGILTAAEASRLDLSTCDLVVLSACETGRGTPEAGQGVQGLVQALRISGARDVVASLWRVDDEATRRLVERFYDGLLRAKEPLAPADALREAALWLRTAKGADGRSFDSPRYWAAFDVYVKR